ncbi:alpha-1A adrenergic receptor isoform X4 [Phyllostomus hastatus]|uniref:alpha-1A adrenergic receptor isoform X4 n=1 Tax=Phyllostomus hastatus TaxID=9423 RepID=UPI001E680AE5|nr:alpha-1A adrenergic receptor isoform X4 [Phyllostomus hastatus]
MVFLSGNASDSSNCTHPPVPVNISKAILLGVILGSLIIFGVLGNILVILSVACHRHLHSVTHYYIVNLAVADLLLTSTVLPFSAIFEILGYWAFGRVFCTIWAAVDVLCCTASIMGLCIISIDRCIGVSYPLRYPTIVTQKRGLMALLCVWALSLVISIGPLFGWRQPAPEDETICQITEEPGYVLFSALGSFYMPLAIILVMYCRVYVVAKRESRGLESGLKTDKSDSEQVTLRIHRKNAPVEGGRVPTSRNKTHFSVRLLKFSREKKAAKTLGIVVGCFVLCWLPFFLVMPIAFRCHCSIQCLNSEKSNADRMELAHHQAATSVPCCKSAASSRMLPIQLKSSVQLEMEATLSMEDEEESYSWIREPYFSHRNKDGLI